MGIGCPIAEILQKNRFFVMASGNQYTSAFFTTFHQFYCPRLLICFKGIKAEIHGGEKNYVAISLMFAPKLARMS